MKSFQDQLGNTIRIPFPPKRIISLVPSQTELLFYLGLSEEIVGITKFCVHPAAQFSVKEKIGGTKKLHLDRIADLQPDLIIGNKEENEKSQIEALQQQFPVWMSDIKTMQDTYEMIEGIGGLVNKSPQAATLVQQLTAAWQNLEKVNHLTCLYLIWRKPYMAAGQATFINEILTLSGFQNLLPTDSRYPALSEEDLQQLNPQVLLLSSEPYPFKEKHLLELQTILPNTKIRLVDGELFSWYGNRLLHTVDYMNSLVFV